MEYVKHFMMKSTDAFFSREMKSTDKQYVICKRKNFLVCPYVRSQECKVVSFDSVSDNQFSFELADVGG